MTAAVQNVFVGTRKVSLLVTGTYSASDETDTNILDISTLTGPKGSAPSKLVIDEIWWSITGYNSVVLEFDRTTDEIVGNFIGQGYIDYRPIGGRVDDGTGGTGDLLLTTTGGSSGGNYSFVITVRLKD